MLGGINRDYSVGKSVINSLIFLLIDWQHYLKPLTDNVYI